MRRALLAGIVLIVTVAIFAFAFRGPLAVRIMERLLEQRLAADAIAELPDGLHLMLCGAGGPLPDPVRSGPCVAVVAGRSMFVVDAGSGAARNLASRGLGPPLIDALFLTHFHSDHIDGIGELALLRWTGSGRRSPLPVHGPPGVREVVQGLNAAYRIDAGYRTAHHGEAVAPTKARGMRARPFATPPAGQLATLVERDGVRISTFRVEHQPAEPAVGYRFDYGGRSVLVSGDTKRSADLQQLAQGVDLLVHEALSPELVSVITNAAAAAGQERLVKITTDILDYHASPVEVAEIAQAAGARHLLYYHIVPPLPLPGLESVFLAGVSDAYAGGVTLGRDGSFVSLPSGGDEISVSTR